MQDGTEVDERYTKGGEATVVGLTFLSWICGQRQGGDKDGLETRTRRGRELEAGSTMQAGETRRGYRRRGKMPLRNDQDSDECVFPSISYYRVERRERRFEFGGEEGGRGGEIRIPFLRFEILGERTPSRSEWAGRLGLIITMGGTKGTQAAQVPPSPRWTLATVHGWRGAGHAPAQGSPRPKISPMYLRTAPYRGGPTPCRMGYVRLVVSRRRPVRTLVQCTPGRRHWPGHVFDSHLSRRVSPLVNLPIFWAGSRRALPLGINAPLPREQR